MERIVEQTMLYDFYGDLLTEHQKEIYEEVVFQDLSISEIAEQQGISRQGVFDLVRRCDRILTEYEEKLHLVKRFLEAKKDVEEILRLAKQAQEENSVQELSQIERIAGELIETL